MLEGSAFHFFSGRVMPETILNTAESSSRPKPALDACMNIGCAVAESGSGNLLARAVSSNSVVLHSIKHLREPMDLPSGRSENRCDTSGFERICNDALAGKTRFYVSKGVQHLTSSGSSDAGP